MLPLIVVVVVAQVPVAMRVTVALSSAGTMVPAQTQGRNSVHLC